MDGIGGTVQYLVFKKVESGHCIIDTLLYLIVRAVKLQIFGKNTLKII